MSRYRWEPPTGEIVSRQSWWEADGLRIQRTEQPSGAALVELVDPLSGVVWPITDALAVAVLSALRYPHEPEASAVEVSDDSPTRVNPTRSPFAPPSTPPIGNYGG